MKSSAKSTRAAGKAKQTKQGKDIKKRGRVMKAGATKKKQVEKLAIKEAAKIVKKVISKGKI